MKQFKWGRQRQALEWSAKACHFSKIGVTQRTFLLTGAADEYRNGDDGTGCRAADQRFLCVSMPVYSLRNSLLVFFKLTMILGSECQNAHVRRQPD